VGQVVVSVNGRAFPLACADGEEARTRRLAQYLDSKVTEFVQAHGQIGEARLILLAALVVCDELSDTSDAFQQERSRPRSDEAGNAVQGIRAIAQRIESIAARLETS
jgi:cell division protein ZapA